MKKEHEKIFTTQPIFEPSELPAFKEKQFDSISLLPEQKSPSTISQFLDFIESLLPMLLFLGISLSKSDIERLFALANKPDSMEKIRDMEEIAKSLPENFDIRAKALKLAAMSIMEFCHTYGCLPEAKKLAYDWEKEKMAKRAKMEDIPASLPSLQDLVKEKELKLEKNVYLTRFVYMISKTVEEKNKEKAYMDLLTAINANKELSRIATNAIIEEEIKKGNFQAAEQIIKKADSFGVGYDFTITLKNDIRGVEEEKKEKEESIKREKKEEQEKQEKERDIKIEGSDYQILIKHDMIKEAMEENKLADIKFDISKDMQELIIRIFLSGNIVANFSGDGIYFVIEKEDSSVLKIVANETFKLDYGNYKLIGPFDIILESRYGHILYKVKEQVIVHLTVKRKMQA
ncbi:MAG: hypothetical protein QXP22_01315 [Candidatus Anstonellales archaeon]